MNNLTIMLLYLLQILTSSIDSIKTQSFNLDDESIWYSHDYLNLTRTQDEEVGMECDRVSRK